MFSTYQTFCCGAPVRAVPSGKVECRNDMARTKARAQCEINKRRILKTICQPSRSPQDTSKLPKYAQRPQSNCRKPDSTLQDCLGKLAHHLDSASKNNMRREGPQMTSPRRHGRRLRRIRQARRRSSFALTSFSDD